MKKSYSNSTKGKRCKGSIPPYEQGSEEYERASLVLFTLFKSQPSERLPFMVNILSIILLLFPRFLYFIYGWCSRFLYEWCVADYNSPSSNASESATYIDVIFNGWEYSGSDVLWASFIHNLYKEVEKKYSRRQINEFNLAYEKIEEKRVSRDQLKKEITRELNKKFKLHVFFMILRLISLLFAVVVLSVWMTHPFNQQLAENIFVQLIGIIVPIIAIVQFVKDFYDKQTFNL